ncbi:hypothetical protein Tco_0364826 [Tanacetum coccineum]
MNRPIEKLLSFETMEGWSFEHTILKDYEIVIKKFLEKMCSKLFEKPNAKDFSSNVKVQVLFLTSTYKFITKELYPPEELFPSMQGIRHDQRLRNGYSPRKAKNDQTKSTVTEKDKVNPKPKSVKVKSRTHEENTT